jgi:hypothetical protein
VPSRAEFVAIKLAKSTGGARRYMTAANTSIPVSQARHSVAARAAPRLRTASEVRVRQCDSAPRRCDPNCKLPDGIGHRGACRTSEPKNWPLGRSVLPRAQMRCDDPQFPVRNGSDHLIALCR